MTDTDDKTHLALRSKRGGGFDAILTLSDGHEIDLAMLTLSDGFAIEITADPPEAQQITLACKLVITEMDVDLDALRAWMVDNEGQDLTLGALTELAAGGAE